MERVNIKDLSDRIKKNVCQVIVGKEEQIEKMLIALLCNGHILLEDIPGTGKTTVAKALARSIGCNFKRVQFTPDLLPSDLTGINFYNLKKEDFVFKKGPIFTHILLADEINRATPRTQSSLLECMEERQVTIDGNTYSLEVPFIVIATQNPVETQGTFPLPEAQLDRFFMRLSLGYPGKENEVEVLTNFERINPLENLKQVVTAEELIEAQGLIKNIKVSREVKEYIVELAEATRNHEKIKMGVSLRGSLALFRGAQAYAALHERDYVLPDDVKALYIEIIAHRIIEKGYQVSLVSDLKEELLNEILSKVAVPIE